MTDTKLNDIANYYKSFNLLNVKNPSNLDDQLLYQLFKVPKKPNRKDATKILPSPKNHTHQIDLLYLPSDDGYKYALVVVDVGSRLTDAEPMKNRDAKTALETIKKIYKRKILTMPEFRINVDDGTEFKGAFKKFFKDNNINVIVAQTGRKSQVALAESRNKSIAEPLLKRQVAQELRTGEQSREWIKNLPDIIKQMNIRFERKDPIKNYPTEYKCKNSECEILEEGTSVRYALDQAINVVTGKKTDSKFRAGDVRYSLKPVKISHYVLNVGQPPMYSLEGKTALYTRNQLIPVTESKMPPDNTQHKFIVEKLLERKKIKNVINFLVKWKDYDDSQNSYELRSKLIKDIPDMVKEYESKNKANQN